MKSCFIILLVFLLSMTAYAQTDGGKTIHVSKDFTLKTNPASADIFAIDNGTEVKLGSGNVKLQLEKNVNYTIEVRNEGYQGVRRVYVREKGGIDEDTVELVNRVLKLSAQPAGAKIYVNDEALTSGMQDIVIRKGQSAKVDVKCPGYVGMSRIFSNKTGDEISESSHQFKLTDRIIALKAFPADATILADEVKTGTGSAEIIVRQNSCVNVTVERPGYVPLKATYCNKEGEQAPPMEDEIKLKDRLTRYKVQPEDASIIVDGAEAGKGACWVKIPNGKCVTVQVQQTGFAPYQETLCNKAGAAVPENVYTVKLVADQTLAETDTAIVNQNVLIDVNPTLAPLDAWKKLTGIIQTKFDEIVSQDPTTSYLRTGWVASTPFNVNPQYSQVIRTRVIITSGTSSPLKFNLKVQSELSKTGKDCLPDGMKYPPTTRDDCYEAYPRISKRFKDLIREIQLGMQ